MSKKKDLYGFDEYVVEVEKDEDGMYVLTIPILSGCMAVADSLGEAYAELELAFADWTEDAAANGETVPAPTKDAEFSGKILLRMPKALHAKVARAAEHDGVSLNTLLVSYVGAGVGAAEQIGQFARQIGVLQSQMADVRSGMTRMSQPERRQPAKAWSLSAPLGSFIEARETGLGSEFPAWMSTCSEERAPGYHIRTTCAGAAGGAYGGTR